MNTASHILCALSVLMLTGPAHAIDYSNSPYYKEGYSYSNASQARLANLLEKNLQEAPSSTEFKDAFAKIQLFARGVKTRLEEGSSYPSPALIGAFNCLINANDLTHFYRSFGKFLIKQSKNTDPSLIKPLTNTLHLLGRSKPNESSTAFKKGQDFGTYLCTEFIANANSPFPLDTEVITKRLMDHLVLYSAHQSRKESESRTVDIFGGFRKSLDLFPFDQTITSLKNHHALVATRNYKLLRWLSRLPETFATGTSLAHSIKQLGQIFIQSGDELAKIS